MCVVSTFLSSLFRPISWFFSHFFLLLSCCPHKFWFFCAFEKLRRQREKRERKEKKKTRRNKQRSNLMSNMCLVRLSRSCLLFVSLSICCWRGAPLHRLIVSNEKKQKHISKIQKGNEFVFGIEVVGRRRRSRPTSWKKNICQVEREKNVLFLSLPNGLGRWQQPDVGGLALVPVATLSDLCASSNVLNTFWSLHSLTLCGRANFPQQ